MKILISDKLSDAGLGILQKIPGAEVLNQAGLGKDVEKLKTVIADVSAIAIRSGTTLTAEIIACAKKLKVIGRAGIGVDNVDVPSATKRGIIVMNTPGGNTTTTAEHAIAMMCALTRQIPQATASIKSGKWEKSKFMGSELYQKTLGIVGCGNIGKIVADRAKGLRMKVIVFDPFLSDEMAQQIGVTKVELDDLFKNSDYITLHVPKNEKTLNLINASAFAKMKKGVYLINCARGGIVNEADLASAIEKKIVAGAALDVFAKEPVDPAHPLLKMDSVICTPHLGAATEEAQENVAVDIAHQIADFLTTGTIQNAVNVPSVSGEILAVIQPFLLLAEKIGKLHGQLAVEAPREIFVEFCGDITKYPAAPMTLAVLKGVLAPLLEEESVNTVNASWLAKERGITVKESRTSENKDYASLITVTLQFKTGKRVIAGTIFGKTHPRLVRIDNYYLEAVPEGTVLVIQNKDQPGVVGNVGTLLAKNNINISRMQLGLDTKTKEALAFYGIEGKAGDPVLAEIRKLPGIKSVLQVVL